MFKNILTFVCSFFVAGFIQAQELNATIQILAPTLPAANTDLLPNMQKAFENLVNNTVWTEEIYEVEEKIECTFILTIDAASNNKYSGTLQVSYSRPVYNSGYKSPVLNYVDKDVAFNYLESEPLEYSENQVKNNLSALSAFYAYLILGLDKDTYSLNGGQPYYLKAQNIVNLSQSGNYRGWKSFDGSKNRFWLIDNILNSGFSDIRNCYYDYHRNGLDLMYNEAKQSQAKSTISKALISLQTIYQKRPNAYILQVFFDAKSDEIVNIFKEGPNMDTSKMVSILKQIDGARNNKYDAIAKR